MKKAIFFLLLASAVLVIPSLSRAQSVAINADSSLPDPSAILDLKSGKKGLLVPRMTMSQRNAITGPATGLLIYQTDNTPGFYCYDGSAWSAVKGSDGGGGATDPFWTLKDSIIYNSNNRHVGIGTDTAQEPLTVQTGDLQRGFSHRGANGKILTSFMGDNFAEFATLENTDLYLGAGGFPHIILQASTGNVGINIANPQNILQVGNPGNTIAGYQFGFGDGTHGSGFNQNSISNWVSTTNMRLLPQLGSGNVGINIGVDAANKLQVGSVGSTGIANNDIAFGNGTAGAALVQTSYVMQLISSTDMILTSKGNTGHVGINSPPSVLNTLQVGNVGSSGFAGNDFAIGNGTQATAFNQYPNVFQIASNTDFAIMPQPGSGGKLGINTTTPRATLDVVGSYNITELSYQYVFHSGSSESLHTTGDNGVPVVDISIIASGNIYAHEFDAYSDIRIKNLIGTSNAKKDLTNINAIKIRDYTMKDQLKYGNRHFKKVIAQEVEKIDPDLVSRHRDFIPNVYQLTDRVTKTPGGYLLHFVSPHHLGDTAKKLQALTTNGGSLQPFDIVSIPSPTEVIIDAKEIKTEMVFVYGEEVPNFRTVDYEGLTTLNISATQELSRQVEDLQKALAIANKNIRTLAKMVRPKTNPPITNRLTSQKLTRHHSTAKQTKNI